MVSGRREDNIRRIIDLEDRISACRRCPEPLPCVRSPIMGKGELEPDIMIVFECENQYARDLERVIELRRLVKAQFKLERIYHTFMIRCTPKACSSRHSAFCYTDSKLLDRDHYCILTEQPCMGLPVPPDTNQIINCLSYLIEEIDILRPRYVLLLGERVCEYVLKCYGIFTSPSPGQSFSVNHMQLLTAVSEQLFSNEDCCKLLASLSA